MRLRLAATSAPACTRAPPADWRPAMRRPTWLFCPNKTRWTSCGSACGTRSRARCSRSPTPVHRIRRALAADADLRTDIPRYRVFSRRRTRRRADGHTRVLARRSGELPARLLVHVRMGTCRRRAAAGASEQGINVPMYVTDRRCVAPDRSRVRWSCRCARSRRKTSPARSRSPRASLPCTEPRSISATPPRSASQTSTPPTSATRSRRAGRGAGLLGVRCDTAGRRRSRQPSLAIFHAPGHMFITDLPHAQFDSQEDNHDRP